MFFFFKLRVNGQGVQKFYNFVKMVKMVKISTMDRVSKSFCICFYTGCPKVLQLCENGKDDKDFYKRFIQWTGCPKVFVFVFTQGVQKFYNFVKMVKMIKTSTKDLYNGQGVQKFLYLFLHRVSKSFTTL